MRGSLWVARVAPEEAAKRSYRVFGKVKLSDAKWSEVAEGHVGDFNFFKVTVEMK